MAPDHTQEAVIAFLSRPEHYGLPPDTTVERVETHGAIVFLAGDAAYKLKRAVKYPYMDYSTPEKRKAMCERELEINRRIAPEIYLEVRSILQGIDGQLRFGPDEAAAAYDHVVVMRRFDRDTLFGRLCERGKLTPELMRELAETVARFHETADITKDYGGASGIAAVVRENNSIFESMKSAPFDADAVAVYAKDSEAALKRVSTLLDRRRDRGRVRRCHGDLHLDNVFLFEGQPMLFDALEFSDAFACIDVLYDLAFLLMDLERHDARVHASTLLNRYLEITQDYDGLAALPLFLSARAAIRAHVSVSRARAANQTAALKEAETYFNLTRKFLKSAPPRLVVIGGLSGTGKTTIARAVAPQIGRAPGAAILRSDITRKRMMNVAETERLPESAYTPEVNAKVFSQMAETAAKILAAGHAVIMDAVYGTADERAEIAAVAAKAGVKFDRLWLEAPPDILAARIGARSGDASDATAAVLKKQRAVIKAPLDWKTIDASDTPEKIAVRVLSALTQRH
jgi:aminoglycoside phosphotransferase family enzyme/cytidylate kinase